MNAMKRNTEYEDHVHQREPSWSQESRRPSKEVIFKLEPENE
jgi:hypothetical protein